MSDAKASIGVNWDVTGHAWAVAMLRQHVLRDTARHAYLITGPRGVGRRTLALRFAQALNCESHTASGDPCGHCYHCAHFAVDLRKLLPEDGSDPGNGHPDLRVIEPVTQAELKEGAQDQQGGSRKESDAESRYASSARSTRVEQVRAERERISLKPFAAKYRVLLFVRFEEATPGASNALLKTLEEAPAHAILLLTANDSESLLPTIVSRCEVIRLQPVPLPEVKAMLERRGADAERANLIAHVSEGCPGTALRLLADQQLLAFRREKLGDLLSLLPATRAHRFAYAARLGGERTTMRDVLMVWLTFWRDVLWRTGGASTPVTNIDRQTEIESIAGRLSLADARRIVASLDEGLRHLDASVNARLLAEVLLLDWPR